MLLLCIPMDTVGLFCVGFPAFGRFVHGHAYCARADGFFPWAAGGDDRERAGGVCSRSGGPNTGRRSGAVLRGFALMNLLGSVRTTTKIFDKY